MTKQKLTNHDWNVNHNELLIEQMKTDIREKRVFHPYSSFWRNGHIMANSEFHQSLIKEIIIRKKKPNQRKTILVRFSTQPLTLFV
jgi:hypothetical protein